LFHKDFVGRWRAQDAISGRSFWFRNRRLQGSPQITCACLDETLLKEKGDTISFPA